MLTTALEHIEILKEIAVFTMHDRDIYCWFINMAIISISAMLTLLIPSVLWIMASVEWGVQELPLLIIASSMAKILCPLLRLILP